MGGRLQPGTVAAFTSESLAGFDRNTHLPRLSGFFGLRESFENAIGRPVDLLMLEAVRNPYLKASLERNRLPLYAVEAGSIDSQARELKVEGLAAVFSRSPTLG